MTVFNANDSNTFACETPGVCLGGTDSACAVGHEGPLCSVCIEGYYANAEELCVPCDVEPLSDGVKAVVLLGGLLLGIAIGLLVMFHAQIELPVPHQPL